MSVHSNGSILRNLSRARSHSYFLGLLWFAAISGLLASVFYHLWTGKDLVTFLVWLCSGAAITGIFLVRLYQISRMAKLKAKTVRAEFRQRLKRIYGRERMSEQDRDPIDQMIKSFLVPRVEVLRGLDPVCREAAKAVEEAHGAKAEQDRFITFYGSASLSTVHAGGRKFGVRRTRKETDEDIQTPEQIYAGALEAASTDQIRMRRYVRLFLPKELELRGRAFVEEYLAWLTAQNSQLKRNPNYRITDVVRAPTWGSNVARIVTSRRLLELVGSGDGGLLLVGEDISASIRRHGRASILARENVTNEPVHYSQLPPPEGVPGQWKGFEAFEKGVLGEARKVVEKGAREGEH